MANETQNNGSPASTCGLGIDNRRRIIALEQNDVHVWRTIDEIRKKLDRPPTWATFLISALSALAAVLGTLLVKG